MDFLLAILPIAILIYVMTKNRSWPSHISLPFAAALVYFLALVHFRLDANLVNATVVNGALAALTPISIIWGAILLSQTMRQSGAERIISEWLKGVSPNPVAQLMIVGWAFPFMMEGASGFGTPAAIAAPLLVGLGFDAVGVTILTLIMNAVPVTFGAVGTPMWFGFSQVPLSPSEILSVSWKSALVHTVAALVVPIIALRVLRGWADIRHNLLFIYLSILSCALPSLFLSRFNYEFPSLIGGAVGLCLSVLLAKYQVGLAHTHAAQHVEVDSPSQHRERVEAFAPYLILIAVLIATRVRFLPFRAWLNAESPALALDLGSLGTFSVSSALVFRLDAIFGTPSAWSCNALFVPALIPFVLVVLLSMPLLRIHPHTLKQIVADTTSRLNGPSITLVGALIMVQLMTLGGDSAQTMIIGRTFASVTGGTWPFFAPVLGALGAFFAGSATVSNLTFAGIQDSIARTLGFDRTSILALQSVGAAMGNMVAISNIVAVLSILGLDDQEGFVLKRTAIPLVVYALVAGVSGLILT
ncbi:MAG TPA: L-lactate permease [Vicinamibacterales bacterium]|nr:L-lactate permease [Vicinamibacterales bacterium]